MELLLLHKPLAEVWRNAKFRDAKASQARWQCNQPPSVSLRIVQLYFERRLSYANVAKVLAAEGYRFKADSMGYDQEIQDAWNPLSSSRKWTPLQANAYLQAPRRVLLPTKLGDRLQKLLTVVAC